MRLVDSPGGNGDGSMNPVFHSFFSVYGLNDNVLKQKSSLKELLLMFIILMSIFIRSGQVRSGLIGGSL